MEIKRQHYNQNKEKYNEDYELHRVSSGNSGFANNGPLNPNDNKGSSFELQSKGDQNYSKTGGYGNDNSKSRVNDFTGPGREIEKKQSSEWLDVKTQQESNNPKKDKRDFRSDLDKDFQNSYGKTRVPSEEKLGKTSNKSSDPAEQTTAVKSTKPKSTSTSTSNNIGGGFVNTFPKLENPVAGNMFVINGGNLSFSQTKETAASVVNAGQQLKSQSEKRADTAEGNRTGYKSSEVLELNSKRKDLSHYARQGFTVAAPPGSKPSSDLISGNKFSDNKPPVGEGGLSSNDTYTGNNQNASGNNSTRTENNIIYNQQRTKLREHAMRGRRFRVAALSSSAIRGATSAGLMALAANGGEAGQGVQKVREGYMVARFLTEPLRRGTLNLAKWNLRAANSGNYNRLKETYIKQIMSQRGLRDMNLNMLNADDRALVDNLNKLFKRNGISGVDISSRNINVDVQERIKQFHERFGNSSELNQLLQDAGIARNISLDSITDRELMQALNVQMQAMGMIPIDPNLRGAKLNQVIRSRKRSFLRAAKKANKSKSYINRGTTLLNHWHQIGEKQILDPTKRRGISRYAASMIARKISENGGDAGKGAGIVLKTYNSGRRAVRSLIRAARGAARIAAMSTRAAMIAALKTTLAASKGAGTVANVTGSKTVASISEHFQKKHTGLLRKQAEKKKKNARRKQTLSKITGRFSKVGQWMRDPLYLKRGLAKLSQKFTQKIYAKFGQTKAFRIFRGASKVITGVTNAIATAVNTLLLAFAGLLIIYLLFILLFMMLASVQSMFDFSMHEVDVQTATINVIKDAYEDDMNYILDKSDTYNSPIEVTFNDVKDTDEYDQHKSDLDMEGHTFMQSTNAAEILSMTLVKYGYDLKANQLNELEDYVRQLYYGSHVLSIVEHVSYDDDDEVITGTATYTTFYFNTLFDTALAESPQRGIIQAGGSGYADDNSHEFIYVFLRDQGYSHEIACGIMGNIACESGDPADASQPFDAECRYNQYYGLFQLGDDRLADMETYCSKHNLNLASAYGQLSFMVDEMKTDSAGMGLAPLRQAFSSSSYRSEHYSGKDGAKTAAADFMAFYERCIYGPDSYSGSFSQWSSYGWQNQTGRMARAADYYDMFLQYKDDYSELSSKFAGGGVQGYVDWAIKIANDPNVGYDQGMRETLKDYVNGKRANGWCDCTSFVYYALVFNNIIPDTGYPFASDEDDVLLANGFEKVTAFHGTNIEVLQPGDIMSNDHHTGIYCGDGWFVDARNPSSGVVYDQYNCFKDGWAFRLSEKRKNELGLNGTVHDGTLSERQTSLIERIKGGDSLGTSAGYCAQYVNRAYNYTFSTSQAGGNADDLYDNYCKYSDKSQLKPGMIIAVRRHSHTSGGRSFGHVGIYLGNNIVIEQAGGIQKTDLDKWINYYSTTSEGEYHYTAKWGWNCNDDLSK